MSPRAWVIYIYCLDKPRSLKKVAKLWGYDNQATLSNKYNGKPVIEWLLDRNFVKFHGKNGREVMFKSNSYFLKGCKLMICSSSSIKQQGKLYRQMIKFHNKINRRMEID